MFHEQIITAGRRHFSGEPLLATIALSDEAVADEAQMEAVIERAAEWEVNGFYVIAETPSSYLVEDPNWLANLLILASGLKLLRKPVLVGYCNHQMLCLAAANVDIVASGTWLNVRAFPTDKFYTPTEDEVSRRTTWYYCPQALSEYTLPFLDIAMRNGVLDAMRPEPSLGSIYAKALFGGAAPSTVMWGEQNAFRHYLTCLRKQCAMVTASSFQGAMESQRRMLDSAESVMGTLRTQGVFGNDRDFRPILDTNRSALIIFGRARGSRLRREW